MQVRKELESIEYHFHNGVIHIPQKLSAADNFIRLAKFINAHAVKDIQFDHVDAACVDDVAKLITDSPSLRSVRIKFTDINNPSTDDKSLAVITETLIDAISQHPRLFNIHLDGLVKSPNLLGKTWRLATSPSLAIICLPKYFMTEDHNYRSMGLDNFHMRGTDDTKIFEAEILKNGRICSLTLGKHYYGCYTLQYKSIKQKWRKELVEAARNFHSKLMLEEAQDSLERYQMILNSRSSDNKDRNKRPGPLKQEFLKLKEDNLLLLNARREFGLTAASFEHLRKVFSRNSHVFNYFLVDLLGKVQATQLPFVSTPGELRLLQLALLEKRPIAQNEEFKQSILKTVTFPVDSDACDRVYQSFVQWLDNPLEFTKTHAGLALQRQAVELQRLQLQQMQEMNQRLARVEVLLSQNKGEELKVAVAKPTLF